MKTQYLCRTLFLSVSLSACGTIKSLDQNNNRVEIKHEQGVTKCETLSRVYSGVHYDLCLLHSKRKKAPLKIQLDPLWLTSIDIVLSAVADTLILPYTLYHQVDKGNLKVEK